MKTILKYKILLFGFAVGLSSPFGVEPVQASQLQSHRAMYSMTLGTAEETGAPSGIRGVMTYEFTEQCEAWSVSTKVYLRLQFGNGPEVESVRKLATREAKDGASFRFRVHESNAKKQVQEIKGVAIIEGEDGAGMAEYVAPVRQKIALPRGTLFPTAHLQKMIASSQRNEAHLGRHLFDGSSMDDPYLVSAVIGKAASDPPLKAEVKKVLGDVKRWNAQLAYFPVKSAAEVPDFELSVRYREDGIIDNISQDYGSYTLEAKLVRVELLPYEANCGQ
ncbi:MAG: DUF1849 family protein [Rhodospirillaceae bacterium]